MQVEQKGEIKMMWKLHQFSTFLTVQEDNRDPTSLMTSFTLIKSVSASAGHHTVMQINVMKGQGQNPVQKA